MNNDSKNFFAVMFEKFQWFLGTSLGKGLSGVIATVIGFFLNACMQGKNTASIYQILNEMRTVDENIKTDQIEKVIEAFFRHGH